VNIVEKGKIIDLFTRRVLSQDTAKNDKKAEDKGVYLGHVHKDTAIKVRALKAVLDAQETQIEHLVNEWEEMTQDYYYAIDQILELLDAEAYDLFTQEMSISKDGHIWIVPLDD